MIRVKIGKSKKYGVPTNAIVLGKAGAILAADIRDRILKTSVDGRGKRLAMLSSKGRLLASDNDLRWKEITPASPDTVALGPTVTATEGGYRRAKQIVTGKTKRDGKLTGAMWDSLKVSPKFRRGKPAVVISFTGKSTVSEVKTEVFNIKTRKGRMKVIDRKRIRNQDKAWFMQHEKPAAKGRRMFHLMSFTQREFGAFIDFIMARGGWE